ncbi:MAG: TonB family protein [Gemmatimonadales bacterium]|nr:TonB family protein [Gemmatimonadales bacterium]NIN10974.1 TonB family protein [Gemmatimonadales bacterium]NIN49566.1 TonB family protein [Gemmatimonadales bacterium]NIP07030.1 TonB family protein [Gemmatimonadales bacterium]NIR01664.1 TonB family protein [Gemmatimonadales bacterium]
MFDILVESNRKKRDFKGYITGMFASTIFQVVLIAGAVLATMGVAEEIIEVELDTIMLVIEEPTEEEPPEEEDPIIVTSLTPPPRGFQVLMAPVDVPQEIPPVDLSARFDPRDYSGVGVEGGVFTGVEGGTGPVDLTQVFAEAVVDEVPERISCPLPDYPRMMQQANIEGQVLLQFVVETDGRVKSENIETITSTHKAFEGPARDMIGKCLFRPGRVRANPVRVLVQMPIIFNLAGRR